jgi:RNA polymerase sigma factor (sigma-70 family)
VEASALQAPAQLARNRLSIGASLLRLRSDEQLVALFREGHDEAFSVIHDRYWQRLFAYTRQMLPGSRQDAEDALQDIFVRAYSGLRANDRDLALRAWLYRVAHNRCIDELRRPPPPAPEVMNLVRSQVRDPIAEAEQRESLRRLILDLRRLPEQQRSALLMRELGGVTYADMAGVLGVSVPAVKSLLVRARVSLAQAAEARDTACSEIRDHLVVAHDRGVRPSGLARRHMHDCASCRAFRQQMRGISREFAGLVPAVGPFAFAAKLLGLGGGGGAAAGSSAAAGGGAAAAGTGGLVASVGIFATGAGHIATLLAAAVVTAGGAVEVQHAINRTGVHHTQHHVRLAAQSTPPVTGAGHAQTAAAAASVGTIGAQPAAVAVQALRTSPNRTSSVTSDVSGSATAGALPTPPSGADYLPSSASGGGTTPGSGATPASGSGSGSGTTATSGGTSTGSTSGITTGTTGTGGATTGTGTPPSGTLGGTPSGTTGTLTGSGPTTPPSPTGPTAATP